MSCDYFSDDDERFSDDDFSGFDLASATLLGSGTFGHVYEVYWPSSQYPVRAVAVKYPVKLSPATKAGASGGGGDTRVLRRRAQSASPPFGPVDGDLSDDEISLEVGVPAAPKHMPRVMQKHANDHLREFELLRRVRGIEYCLPTYPRLAPPFWSVRKVQKALGIVSKLCNQGSLRDVCELSRTRGFGPTAWIGHIGLCLASALSEMHSKGIIHGDLSQKNILLHSRFKAARLEPVSMSHDATCLMYSFPYVADLGSAIEFVDDPHQFTGGTVTAMPPELESCHGDRERILAVVAGAWEKIDVWSLGMCLLNLAYGSIYRVELAMRDKNLSYDMQPWFDEVRAQLFCHEGRQYATLRGLPQSFKEWTAFCNAQNMFQDVAPYNARYGQLIAATFDHDAKVVSALNGMLRGMLHWNPAKRWNWHRVLNCVFMKTHGTKARAAVIQHTQASLAQYAN